MKSQSRTCTPTHNIVNACRQGQFGQQSGTSCFSISSEETKSIYSNGNSFNPVLERQSGERTQFRIVAEISNEGKEQKREASLKKKKTRRGGKKHRRCLKKDMDVALNELQHHRTAQTSRRGIQQLKVSDVMIRLEKRTRRCRNFLMEEPLPKKGLSDFDENLLKQFDVKRLRLPGKRRILSRQKPLTRMKKAIIRSRQLKEKKVTLSSTTSLGHAQSTPDSCEAEDTGRINLITKNANHTYSEDSPNVNNSQERESVSSNAPQPKGHRKEECHRFMELSYLGKPYMCQVLSQLLDTSVRECLAELRSMQEVRLKGTEGLTRKYKKLYVGGFREVKKLLVYEKIKCIIIATNIEVSVDEGK